MDKSDQWWNNIYECDNLPHDCPNNLSVAESDKRLMLRQEQALIRQTIDEVEMQTAQ